MIRRLGAVVVAAAAALGGCGGGGTTTVGGTVVGLAPGTAVTLQINGRERLVVGEDGPFQFTDELLAEANYDVRIVTQPAQRHCEVIDGSGIIDRNASRVTNVSVQCVPAFAVGGLISGLATGNSITLTDGTDTTTFTADGSFAFPTLLPTGSAFDVKITTQPTGRTCNVTRGSGTVQTTDVNTVLVSC